MTCRAEQRPDLSCLLCVYVRVQLQSLELGSLPNSFRKNHIDAAAACEIAAALCDNRTLTALGLRANIIGKTNANAQGTGPGAGATAAGATGSGAGAGAGAGGGANAGAAGALRASEKFAEMLARNRTLTYLSLEENGLQSRGASILCKALADNKHFRHLNIGVRSAEQHSRSTAMPQCSIQTDALTDGWATLTAVCVRVRLCPCLSRFVCACVGVCPCGVPLRCRATVSVRRSASLWPLC
jgi:hypothetical protein